MSLKETILKAGQNVRARVENALGRGCGMEPLAVRREIFNQIESRIIEDGGERLFPFGKVVVRFRPETKEQSIAIEEALVEKGTLKSDILRMLEDARVRYPSELETLVEFRWDYDSAKTEFVNRPPFEMDFVNLQALRKQSAPETKLQILAGAAEQTEYAIKKDRILIGRSPEVLDREGRMVRRNDIVFLENDEEVNRSVGRTHARIWYAHDKGEFFILDEGSRYGTRVLRGGAVIEVPGGEPGGIALKSGDDIYCGQACLRLTLA